MRTLVTLTTDFGTRDPYVAEMKGVLYAQGPRELELVDLTHEIAPQNIWEAALFARAAWQRFPAGTIHVIVVDPGVGSARRALVCAHAGQLFVGPDNGVMSLALGESHEAFELRPERFVSGMVSATFHGRDVFAPAAARLAHGDGVEVLGDAVAEIVRLAWPGVDISSSELRGVVIHTDRFGNLISNISRADLIAWLGPRKWSSVRVQVAGSAWSPLATCYTDAAEGGTVALFGSADLLEVAVTNGSAAAQLNGTTESELTVRVTV